MYQRTLIFEFENHLAFQKFSIFMHKMCENVYQHHHLVLGGVQMRLIGGKCIEVLLFCLESIYEHIFLSICDIDEVKLNCDTAI